MSDMIDLIDRAARDPEFLQRLQSDPLGTAHAAGVSVPHAPELLGAGPVAESLQARLSYSVKGDPPPQWGQWGPAQAGSMGIPTN